MNNGESGRGLIAEQDLKRRMRDSGIDPADPAAREAWEAGADAAMAGVAAVLAAMRGRWVRGATSGDTRDQYVNGDDLMADLVSRLFPLVPGEPVRFQRLGGQRWLRGTVEGPVSEADPCEAWRGGDLWVRTASGQREPVFLTRMRRVSPHPAINGTGD